MLYGGHFEQTINKTHNMSNERRVCVCCKKKRKIIFFQQPNLLSFLGCNMHCNFCLNIRKETKVDKYINALKLLCNDDSKQNFFKFGNQLQNSLSISNKCYCLSPKLFGEAECEQILKWMSDAAIEPYEPINFEQTDILDRYIF